VVRSVQMGLPSIQRIHCIPSVDLAVDLCAWHRRGLQMLPARGVLRRTVVFRQMRVNDTVPRPAVGGLPRKSSHIVPPACLYRAGICSPEGCVSILRARMDWQNRRSLGGDNEPRIPAQGWLREQPWGGCIKPNTRRTTTSLSPIDEGRTNRGTGGHAQPAAHEHLQWFDHCREKGSRRDSGGAHRAGSEVRVIPGQVEVQVGQKAVPFRCIFRESPSLLLPPCPSRQVPSPAPAFEAAAA
jgi:hypothetical protein